MQNISLQIIHFLIYRYSPILWLHPMEVYNPLSVEHYINHSQLVCNNVTVLTAPALNDATLHETVARFDADACYLKPQAHASMRTRAT